MFDEVIDVLRAAEKNDDLFTLSASLIKKSFDALIEVGFSEEQATRIVASQGAVVKTS
jgi:hypothetical protein